MSNTQRERSIRARPPLVWPLLCALLATATLSSCAQSLGAIRGRAVRSPGAPDAPGGEPLVVVAEPVGATVPASSAPGQRTICRRAGRFVPSFLVIATGQAVRFANDDGICHRLFSSSESNAFELDVLHSGDSGTVRLERPGVVRVYCSLHEAERVLIFVAPTPHFGTVGPSGEFEIAELSPGRYELHAWGEHLSSPTLPVTVRAGRAPRVEISLEASDMVR
jgi:plastocyanin